MPVSGGPLVSPSSLGLLHNLLSFAPGLIIALMMEAARTSETSVNFNVTTRRYIPEDTKLHTRRHENMKSHMETL
jgi:hypothetical protein